jgi:hypothetical protein
VTISVRISHYYSVWLTAKKTVQNMIGLPHIPCNILLVEFEIFSDCHEELCCMY